MIYRCVAVIRRCAVVICAVVMSVCAAVIQADLDKHKQTCTSRIEPKASGLEQAQVDSNQVRLDKLRRIQIKQTCTSELEPKASRLELNQTWTQSNQDCTSGVGLNPTEIGGKSGVQSGIFAIFSQEFLSENLVRISCKISPGHSQVYKAFGQSGFRKTYMPSSPRR